jgi:flagellar biosynthetic protein FliO
MRRMWVAILVLMMAAGAVSAQSTQPATPLPTPAPAAQSESNLIRRTATSAPDGSSRATLPISPGNSRVLMSLGAVLGLIILMYWISRRVLPRGRFGPGARAVQVLGRTSISSKQRLLIVQVGRRVLVLADSGQRLNTLCEITDPDEAAALIGQLQGEPQNSKGKSFGAALSGAMDRFQSVSGTLPKNSDDATEELDATRQELSGLMQRVRVMTRQIDRA